MTARETFLSSQATAQTTAVASFNANATAYNNSVAGGTTPAAAQAVLVLANLKTEMARQVSIQAAKDVLKGTGDTAPT